jgi:hypothetical protein
MRGIKISVGTTVAVGLLVGSAVGVPAQDEPAAPVEFTGMLAFSGDPCPATPTITSGSGKSEYRGDNYCLPMVVEPFSDERLAGDYYVWTNRDVYDSGPTIWAGAFSIVTDDGAWRGLPDVYLDEAASGEQILVGEGAYEGLTALATVDLDDEVWTWHGWIIDGEMPPLPEEPEAIP